MGGYIIRRLLWIPVILVVVSAVTFTLTRYVPGDPVELRTQGRASPEAVERVRQQLDLDKPKPVQFAKYMVGFVQGDMGESIVRYPGVPVWDLIRERIWITAQLNLAAIALVAFLGVAAGSVAARNVGTWKDPATISMLLLFQSIPTVVFIPLLLYLFVIQLHWLPAAGWNGLFSVHIIIPLLAMVLPSLAGVARLTRISLLQTMGQDWVRTARAKGLPERNVFFRHIFRPALLPLNTQLGIALFTIFSGSVFVELLYGIPGMGRLALDAVFQRDYDIIMAVFLITTIPYLIGLLAVDLLYTLIDPRIRLGQSER